MDSSEQIYLQKSPRELTLEDFPQAYSSNFETIKEYVERIKIEKQTIQLKIDVEYHIRQLLDIMVDTELIYEWLKIKYAPDSVKATFLLGIKSKEQLDHLVNYSKRNYCIDDNSIIERNYQETLDELYGQILKMQVSVEQKHLGSLKYLITYTENFLAALLNVSIMVYLGLQVLPTNDAKRYLFPMMSEQEGLVYAYDYIQAPIFQYDKRTGEVIRFENNTNFYSNVARTSYKGIIQILDAVYSNETDEEPSKREVNSTEKTYSSKSVDYSNYERDELIKLVYEKYPMLPENFFKILTTHKYVDLKIDKIKKSGKDYLLKVNDDNKSFTIKDGYFSLIVTYIWSKVSDGKGSGSWSLLLILFNRKLKNPSSTLKLYEEDYFENHLKPFEEFLLKYKEA